MPRKRKTEREQNQGLIEIKISLGKNMNGKRVQKSFYGKTKGEAREKAEEYKIKFATGEIANKSSITLAEWAEKWAKTYKQDKIKSSTYKFKYESFLETRLKPFYKNAKIANISQIDIQNFINAQSDVHKDTQKRYLNMLKSIFESAVDNNLIIKNPVRNIALKTETPHKIKRTYTQAEVEKVIQFAENHEYGAAIIIFLKTGLRRGELLAL